MNTNDFLTIVKDIELPKINVVPYAKLSSSEVKALTGKNSNYNLYNFATGNVEIFNNYHDYNEFVEKQNTAEIRLFDASYSGNCFGVSYFEYFKYIEEMDAMGIYLLSINTKKIFPGETREFKLVDYYYVMKDKSFVYKFGKDWKAEYDVEVARKELPFSFRVDTLFRSNYAEEIVHLFGLYCRNGKYSFSTDSRDLLDFFKPVEEENITKRLRTISEKHMKKELSTLCYTPVNKNNYYNNKNVAKLEYIDDSASVIRWFKVFHEKDCYEFMRFYVTDDGNFLCQLENDGKFHVLTKNIEKDSMEIMDLIMDKEELKDSKFKYFFEMIESFKDHRKAVDLYETFRFDLIEKFFKTGLSKLANDALCIYRDSRILPYTTIGKTFSVKINAKETDIYKALKINKYQYKKIAPLTDEYFYYCPESSNVSFTLRLLRLLLVHNEFDALNNVDNATFDKFFDLLYGLASTSNYNKNNISEFVVSAKKMYSLDAIYNGLKVISILNTTSNSHEITLLRDYVRMVEKLDDAKSFPLKINASTTLEDIKNQIAVAHDAVIGVYNLKRDEIKAAQFGKAVKKCEKWVYEEDELTVIAPTLPGDLAKEGIELHHCVKSYIEKVANGKTNIMFIRKKTELDKPFFTVEVGNNGVVEQVHGFGNRNANTEPGLEDFVSRWAKDRKLTLSSVNKIR